jgi:hypothetical protein
LEREFRVKNLGDLFVVLDGKTCVGSCFKVIKDNISSLVAECPNGGFMR